MKKSALIVGGGCLGCLAVPSLLAIGGAAGWLLANNRHPEMARLELDTDALEDRELVLESVPVNEKRRDALVIEPVRPASTPTPFAELRTLATPAPVATEAPVVARKLETAATPAPVVARKPEPVATSAPVAVARKAEALKAAPLPKSTPRRFDDFDLDDKLAKAKPAKTPALASASGATAAGQQTAEDQAAAALFGDAPGVPVKAAPAAVSAPAPAVSSKVRSIKTRGGKVAVTIGNQIVVQSADKKTLLGTLEKVEAGWVFVRGSDNKVKMVAENDIIEASEL